ncbi:diaminopimelate epimerase [Staphylococcus saccharolyticus]|uniref:Diaminopimelate epimerase n=2 Tax=Staphylococcus saccharolyticus TaxID=33028 RepID=A0A380GWD7_9STAP|nr:diaminopimelate epimerase [Staphylococcus saccharolyticus]
MATTHVCCEQVGFIESINYDDMEHYHLVMSGNELCGNATMSYIQYLNERLLLQHQQFQLKVSGCSHLVPCTVHNHQCYEVGMPQVQCVTRRRLKIAEQEWSAIEISYESYVHYVIACEDTSISLKQKVEEFVRHQSWHTQYKTVGVMLFQPQQQFLQPLIFIPEVQSLVWENGCGSGVASIGVYLNYQTKGAFEDYKVNQPDGSIRVTSSFSNEQGYQTSIKGQVSTVATGQAYIEQETMTQI